jgi:hypothetical protein
MFAADTATVLLAAQSTVLVMCQDSYRLCYVRGPEGIIVELAEQIG